MSLSRPCPVCHTPAAQAHLFLEERIDPALLSRFSYASRKEPEYMRLRLVRCPTCDLIYADQPPAQAELAQAYHLADYDSAEEANDAAHAYLCAIAPILEKLPQKQRVLEIGSGTGVFLELLQEKGFTELVGIEPSAAALAAAPAHRRDWLRQEIFTEPLFEPASFDLICCFMTLEHVREPLDTALSAWRLLRPGGAFVTVTHDYRSAVNRVLGEKSPIIDIEHMQLFSKTSVVELFKRAQFTDISATPFRNRYAVDYWTRLLPLPKLLKNKLKQFNALTGLGQCKISLAVGNTLAAGFRPAGDALI